MFTSITFLRRATQLVSSLVLLLLLSVTAPAAQVDEIVTVIQSLENIGFSKTEIATEIRGQFGQLDEETLNSLKESGVDDRTVNLLRDNAEQADEDPAASKAVDEVNATSSDDPQAFTYVDELFEIIENLTRLGFTDEEIYERIYEEQDLPDADEIDELESRGVSDRLLTLFKRGEDPAKSKKPRSSRKDDDDKEDEDRSPQYSDDSAPQVTIARLRERRAGGESLEEIILSIADQGDSVVIDSDTIKELQKDGRLLDVMIPLIDPDQDISVSMPNTSRDDDTGFLAGTGRLNGSALLDVDDIVNEAQVPALLASAKTAYDNLRLTTPQGDSAFDYYNQVLEIEPNNSAAKSGIEQIVERYIELAQSAASKGQRRIARRYLDTAKRVLPSASARIDSAQAAMLPAFNPDAMQSISQAKRAYLQGKMTKPVYQSVVARLKSNYRKQINDYKLKLESGDITRVEYKQKVRAAKIKLQG